MRRPLDANSCERIMLVRQGSQLCKPRAFYAPERLALALRPTFLALSVLLAVGFPPVAYGRNAAAKYYFDSWTTVNGLPQNSCNAILQTRDGYLWIATADGLVRYDGARFTV